MIIWLYRITPPPNATIYLTMQYRGRPPLMKGYIPPLTTQLFMSSLGVFLVIIGIVMIILPRIRNK